MKNKNYYKNLFDSICVTALLFGTLLIYVIALYWSVLHPSEGTNSMVALIALTVLFGTGSIVLIILIITQCFAYWRIENNMLVFKKLFRKAFIIQLEQIEKVEKKEVSAFILGSYKSDAYIITSIGNKVVLLINKKNKEFLHEHFQQYLSHV